MHDKTEQKIKSSVAKSAVYFAIGTFISRLAGLVRESLLVAIFDKDTSDAWNAAFRFPNLFRRIFGEGALSTCFIPLYMEYKERGDKENLAKLSAGVFGLLLAVLVPITIFVIMKMDSIIGLWVSGEGFSAVPGKLELTIKMTKIMFPFLLLMSLYAYLMAVLNAHKKFMLSSLAPLFLNLANISGCLYCYFTQQISGVILSWFVLFGGFLQFAFLIPSFVKLRIPFKFRLNNLWSLPVRRTLRAFAPSVFGLGIIQFMALVNVTFASQLQQGSITYINLADRLLELPLSLIAVSLGTALLPTLSEYVSSNDFDRFKDEIFKNLKLLLLLCVPASVGLWMTSKLLVSVMFERGAFTTDQVLIVSDVVKIYSFTLIAASLTRTLAQAFYAEKKTMVPALASLVGFLFHVVCASFFMKEWGLNGLVISTCVATFLNCFVLLCWFYARHGSLHFVSLVGFLLKIGLASTAIMGVSWVQNTFYNPETFLQKLIALAGVVLWSVVLFFIFAKMLRVEEADWLLRKLVRRTARR